MTLHRPHGTLSTASDVISLTPEDAGWAYTGLRVLRVEAGGSRTVETGEFEAFVLPLAGSLAVEVDGERYELQGRDSVFTRVTDFAYVPRDASVVLSSVDGCEIALPMARCSRRLAPKYGPADAVPVEVRGSGNATRQVTNFGVPGVWDHADKLNACELITPDGRHVPQYPAAASACAARCPVRAIPASLRTPRFSTSGVSCSVAAPAGGPRPPYSPCLPVRWPCRRPRPPPG
jgi:5-deoxy-glucuronate isomerase